MNDKVVSLDEVRTERSPHVSGEALCMRCRHEWVAVTPVGHVAELECPGCGCHAGVMKATCTPADGVPIWVCKCGCDAFRAKVDGLLCISCGVEIGYDEIAAADWS
ncbi:hypothetical protein [Salinisphaera hydrothermalis]|uniref:Uncharacterized protein n=1 Tax=Salinisphaera hydrothermalis (strain C41B8) TaxID=1304275 RepID=A0A084INP4_SALHC|nr:hypothetical protein [Salinisphaera hydrothermalis]KEZ78328.1 hypothetical protein C41B8_05483 [Salinisphaera hydrothermalis C41B8]